MKEIAYLMSDQIYWAPVMLNSKKQHSLQFLGERKKVYEKEKSYIFFITKKKWTEVLKSRSGVAKRMLNTLNYENVRVTNLTWHKATIMEVEVIKPVS